MTTSLSAQDGDRLHHEHVEPLEQDHRGEYVGVSLDGRIIRPTLLDAVRESVALFGKDSSVVFRIGDKVVRRVR